MTCGSKKHIEEALAKIKVKNLEEHLDESKPEPEQPKRKRAKMLQENG